MNRKIFKIVLIILLSLGGVVAIGGGIFIYLLVASISNATTTVTDVSQYRQVRGRFEPNSPLIKHFPNEIPNDAKNVRLYFVPGFLQGATIFRLRMNLPPEKIKKLQAQFRKNAKSKPISSNNILKHNCNGYKSGYKFYEGVSSDQNFLPNHQVFVLEDTSNPPECNWNHPELYGVSINILASEIIYWAEDW